MSKKATAGSKDRFGDLTDDLLGHVLSFLPLEDALQTCVLDTRWRNHWRRTTTQDFIVGNSSTSLSCERLKQLVKLFIHLRGSSPLDECNIDVCRDDDEKGTYRNTELLIAYALECQVRELLVTVDYFGEGQRKLHKPLISQHLKTLHLEWVKLQCSALNFLHCPVLEDLKMRRCIIYAHRISSKSLKRLCITGSCCFAEDFHTRIFAPNLISLQLDGFDGFPPFIEYMPFLVEAYVRLGDTCFDFCRESDDCGCYDCPVFEGVLNGLTNAVNLEFVSENGMFSDDLWCSVLVMTWRTHEDLMCLSSPGTYLCSFPPDFHIRIFAPGLISLQLDGYSGLTPSLEYVPSLVTAYVGLGAKCDDYCQCTGLHFMDEECSCHAYPVDEGVLLHGLSNTANLELIAGYKIEMALVSTL